jgi:hypothetical protein
MWSTLISTNSHLYVVGSYKNEYLVGRFAKDSVPDDIRSCFNGIEYLYNNRYTRNSFIKKKNDIINWMMDMPVIRSAQKFKCNLCNENSILYSPISCMHETCSRCVSKMITQDIPCVLCDQKTEQKEWSKFILNGIPYADLLRILQTIRLSDRGNINTIGGF